MIDHQKPGFLQRIQVEHEILVLLCKRKVEPLEERPLMTFLESLGALVSSKSQTQAVMTVETGVDIS